MELKTRWWRHNSSKMQNVLCGKRMNTFGLFRIALSDVCVCDVRNSDAIQYYYILLYA